MATGEGGQAVIFLTLDINETHIHIFESSQPEHLYVQTYCAVVFTVYSLLEVLLVLAIHHFISFQLHIICSPNTC